MVHKIPFVYTTHLGASGFRRQVDDVSSGATSFSESLLLDGGSLGFCIRRSASAFSRSFALSRWFVKSTKRAQATIMTMTMVNTNAKRPSGMPDVLKAAVFMWRSKSQVDKRAGIAEPEASWLGPVLALRQEPAYRCECNYQHR